MAEDPNINSKEIIGGHFRVERELGHGGMATVYLCTDTRSGEHVAVKELRPELGSVVTTERFFREIAFTQELDHPGIPRVFESGVGRDDLPFYAMDYVEGESLRDRLIREKTLSLQETVRLAQEIAGPMTYAHARGIVHRDIKPENILLSRERVYVLDFGVARAIVGAAGERLTRTGITVGTPAYMSPEQVRGDRDLDYRSDIYSLGCVVYEMLAGVPPFQAATAPLVMAARFNTPPKPLSSIRDDIPVRMERAIQRAMARTPNSRWQSAEEFVNELAASIQVAPHDVSPDEEVLARLRAIFADTYKVEGEMKGGGMSRLFMATDLALNRKVVIKILPPEMVSPMMLARFKRESEVTAKLQHPHILPVISAGVRDGLVYYVMPFIDGESLRARLERENQLPINDAVRLLREVTDALAYAHRQGIVHRDIKPENILIQDGHAVLADFGIAAAFGGSGSETGPRLTGTGMSLGTVGYMAPEQALGERNIDARADVYAVGVVGYEMFAGDPPFTGETDQAILVAHLTREAQRVDAVRVDTPPAVATAIAKAMAKDPSGRFQTAGEFREALDATVVAPQRAPVHAPTQKRKAAPPPPPQRSNKRIIYPIAAVALIGAAVYAVSKFGGPRQVEETVTIAIAPFNAPTAELALWREGMVDVLARNLDGAGPLRTISPTISIKGFPAVGNRQAATMLARRTNAEYAIFGTIVGSSRDSVRVRVSLVDIAKDVMTDGEIRDATVEAAAGQVTRWALDELGKTHRIGAVRQSSFGSKSIDAMRAFLQGEQFFRRTSWDSAGISYQRAISFDPSFAVALRRAAQVAGFQKNVSDSAATSLSLRAGRANTGQSRRDSLLILADSLSAALSLMSLDTLDWNKARRLFSTVNDAAARYPDDPEVWYAVGEARFHYGFGSPVNVTEPETLEAFDRAIALDSAFAPAYVHAIDLGFTLRGAEEGLRYTRAYLKLSPTDKEAEGIEIIDRAASSQNPGAAAPDEILDNVPSDALMNAWYLIRRWPDSSETALRLLNSLARRPRGSPTFETDSVRLWNFMPLELAYRGRLSEAYLELGKRPWRLFVEVALLGGIPADTATATTQQWVADGIPQAFFAMPWLARVKDIRSLQVLAARADGDRERATEKASRRSAQYKAMSARAYLSLARGDTSSALKQFSTLPDTLCIACYIDRVTAAQLLIKAGKDDDAYRLLSQRLNTLISPIEILVAAMRAPLEAKMGRNRDAYYSYKRVADAWTQGDPVIQQYVEDARREMARIQPRIADK
ncbi:MAG TPA: protein kinase [Gemmatimonadaceae bacterium]|nr:protein kinase [Gemmatimonadaceae bacterium]